MTEEEAKKYLQNINSNVEAIRKKVGGRWTSLFNGILTGFGSVVGVALAIFIIGWVLNIVGVIPAFKEQAKKWELLLQSTQTYRSAAPSSSTPRGDQ